MKPPIAILFALFFALLLVAGCGPKTITATYYVQNPGYDSLYIEWFIAGSNQRMSIGLPDQSDFSNIAGRHGARLLSIMDIDLDQTDELLPSSQLDSLFLYTVIDGQSSLIYSGINDDDWRESVQKDNDYFYSLNP